MPDKYVEDFERAVRDYALRNYAPVEDRSFIEIHYQTTKSALERYIKSTQVMNKCYREWLKEEGVLHNVSMLRAPRRD